MDQKKSREWELKKLNDREMGREQEEEEGGKGNTNDAARLVTGGWMSEWTMMKCDSDNDKAILSVADNLRRNKMGLFLPLL